MCFDPFDPSDPINFFIYNEIFGEDDALEQDEIDVENEGDE